MATRPGDRDLTLPGLTAPAEIRIDPWGVAHIRAGTRLDAFRVQGFNAARDRLWQLDLWRKRGLGRLAGASDTSDAESMSDFDGSGASRSGFDRRARRSYPSSPRSPDGSRLAFPPCSPRSITQAKPLHAHWEDSGGESARDELAAGRRLIG